MLGFANLCCCCDETVKVTLRRMADGTPIEGATVEIRSQFGSPGTLYGSGTTDADGVWRSPGFAITLAYRVIVAIDSQFLDNDGDPIPATFTATYTGTRACGTEHEYDFCEAELELTALACGGSSGAITGLIEDSAGAPDPIAGAWGVQVGNNLGGLGSTVRFVETPTPWFSEYKWGGFVASSSDGVYRDVWFLLVERPYTLASPIKWRWAVEKNPLTACDNAGRHKPACGEESLLCGETNAATAELFDLGSDWTSYAGVSGSFGDGGNCGWGCRAGPYGANLNLDCTPSGLVNRTLNVFVATNDDVNSAGDLEGQTVELHCAQDAPGGPIYWTSDPIPNNCGGYYCGTSGLITPYYQTTTIRLFKTGDATSLVAINGAPIAMPCGGGLFFQAVGGGWNSARTFDGTTCHPTLVDFSGFNSTGFGIGVEGQITE